MTNSAMGANLPRCNCFWLLCCARLRVAGTQHCRDLPKRQLAPTPQHNITVHVTVPRRSAWNPRKCSWNCNDPGDQGWRVKCAKVYLCIRMYVYVCDFMDSVHQTDLEQRLAVNGLSHTSRARCTVVAPKSPSRSPLPE